MIKGSVLKFGNNIDTDQIYPGKYLSIIEPNQMAQYAFEGISPNYASKLNGAIIVAGSNFGCGSSREQAAISLQYAGVKAIVAQSFARIFYRNAINQGILLCQIDNLLPVRDGDEIVIDIENGLILHPKGRTPFISPPQFLLEIIKYGGLIEYTKKKLSELK
ncbi:MAG: LeuD/DmdB family oxidoreductase small subunit [bacterium]